MQSELSPEMQQEIAAVDELIERIETRQSYSASFGDRLKRLNALCARVFHAPPDAPQTAAGSN